MKKLKQYLRKKFEASDIARMLDMEVEVVKAKIDEIQNSKKEPIKGVIKYESGTDKAHKTFIPPFIKATISIDADDQPIK